MPNGGFRRCKRSASRGSNFCHLHLGPPRPALPPLTADSEAPELPAVPTAALADRPREPSEVTALIADAETWPVLVDRCQLDRFGRDAAERRLEKDLWITEVIRHALVTEWRYADASIVFKGGTGLMKAWQVLRRFSEDVDVMAALAPGSQASGGQRKDIRRKLRANLRSTGLAVEEPRVGDFAKFDCHYPSMADAPPRQTFVAVDLVVRHLDPRWIALRRVQSLVGAAADEDALDRYPFLGGFGVLTAHPLITLTEKLSALHNRSVSDHPARATARARDAYDIPNLLRSEHIAPRLHSDLIAELHAGVLGVPAGIHHRPEAPRPRAGFAASPAFMPGHPACEALRAAYPSVLDMVFDEAAVLSFDEALAIIHDHAEVL